MNRADFQQLAQDRILDAQALLAAQRWSGAYYLAGYAVECALKASIAKLTNQHDFPDKQRVQKCYTHDFNALVDAAELTLELKSDADANPTFGRNWLIVKDWNEAARYRQYTQLEAEAICGAVLHGTNGVMQWIKLRW